MTAALPPGVQCTGSEGGDDSGDDDENDDDDDDDGDDDDDDDDEDDDDNDDAYCAVSGWKKEPSAVLQR